MAILYITSPSPGEGKTTIASGLLRVLGGAGDLGYARVGTDSPHADAIFVKRGFGPTATAEQMTIDGGDVAAPPGLGARSAIVEGDAPPRGGVPTLIVAGYRGDETVDRLVGLTGEGTIGVILNAVPLEQHRVIEREVRPALHDKGIRLLGVIGETRTLRAFRVRDLATFLDADVLTAEDRLDNLAESVMIGAMSHAGTTQLPYFNRMQEKVVVTGGNRIDVHMAALGTPCQALVLTGGYDPDPVVIERAEAEECPLLRVLPETVDTVDRLGSFLRDLRFSHEERIGPAADLIRRHVETSAIESALGLTAGARA